jgi:glycosyltransferase involved in cell wall biosynthesis
MRDGISIVICCYNSAARLPETLKYLAAQDLPSNIAWEIIVVDNASTDDTAHIALAVWQTIGGEVPLQVVEEKKPGLRFAREKGFELSVYRYILFVDDDNWLAPDYLELSFQIMQSNAKVAALGGLGEPVCETAPPSWFEKCKDHYAVGKQHTHSTDITTHKGYVYGAGMVVNKEAWLDMQKSGYESILSDRKGTLLSSGGDMELCFVFRMLGYRIWYDEKLTFKHFIPSGRLKWQYLVNLFKQFAEAEVYMEGFKYFKQKPYAHANDFEKAYIKALVKASTNVLAHARQSSKLLFTGIQEGDKALLYAKFYIDKVKILVLQRQRFLTYLSYLSDFKRKIVAQYQSLANETVS